MWSYELTDGPTDLVVHSNNWEVKNCSFCTYFETRLFLSSASVVCPKFTAESSFGVSDLKQGNIFVPCEQGCGARWVLPESGSDLQ